MSDVEVAIYTVAYLRGGHGAMPPSLWPDHEKNLQGISRKLSIFAVSIERPKAKSASALGGLRPLTP